MAQGRALCLAGVCLGTPTRLGPLTRLPALSERVSGPVFTVLWSGREASDEARTVRSCDGRPCGQGPPGPAWAQDGLSPQREGTTDVETASVTCRCFVGRSLVA